MADQPVPTERRLNADDFYVGYLPTPPSHARFLRGAIPLCLAVMFGSAAMIARLQRDPGDAVWRLDAPVTFDGVLRVHPYPMLEIMGADGARSIALLVEMGKHGAQARAAAFDGKAVRVQGWTLQRDGRTIVELQPESSAIQAHATQEPRERWSEKPLGPVVLRGEIVDSKCFLGAMKPGDGKGHKSCATLCVQGGIPPVFVSILPDGTRRYHVLRTPEGGPCGDEILPMIGEPVEVRGVASDVEGMRMLNVRGADVRRLP